MALHYTPQNKAESSDSGFESFNASTSTPLVSNVRKRKASHTIVYSNLVDVVESPLPQFSSTLNESLTKDFEKCLNIEGFDSCKLFRENGGGIRFCSVPSTPEKNFSLATSYYSSPAKESYSILYQSIPQSSTEKKQVSKIKPITPAKKRLFVLGTEKPFKKVFQNHVICSVLFKFLSDGDLYRLSQVSKLLEQAVKRVPEAKRRYLNFLNAHKVNKENYKITPPNSPEKVDEPLSPRSMNYKLHQEIVRKLNKNQKLTKCPKCLKPSIVENDLCQCSNENCGYIFCQKCGSFALSPEDFIDKCQNSKLELRQRLLDLSNSSFSFLSSSNLDSSGYLSSRETTPKYRRNLNKSLSERSVLSSNSRVTGAPKVFRKSSILVPVVPVSSIKEVADPPSPQNIKTYGIGSKQSKKNLKRLIR